MTGLEPVFDPDTVAVIGATDREGSVGRSIMSNLDRTFDGQIVPVNPNREDVLGYDCVPEVGQAPEIDLAVIVLPALLVPETLDELSEANVRHSVVISAGFREAGPEGAALERELVDRSSEYGMQIVGPNSLGVMSTSSGLNASFGPAYPSEGPVSMVSQSGAFVTAILDWTSTGDLGFRHVISLGNEAVVDETDVIEYWAEDAGTSVVMGYLEGIDEGRAFIDSMREITSKTPVVVVKSGRTEAGSRAASSHTGSMAGDDAAYTAAFEQAGVIRAHTVEELIDATQALSTLPGLDGDGIAVVTNAGGPGVMATDAIGDSRLDLVEFSSETIASLEEVLSEGASVYNPVDILGDAHARTFEQTVEIAMDDANVSAVLVVAAPTGVLSFSDLSERLVGVTEDANLPVVFCAMGRTSPELAGGELSAQGIPTYFDPSRAVNALSVLSRQREIAERSYEDPQDFPVDRETANAVLGDSRSANRHRMGLEGLDMLDAYGVSTPPGKVVKSPAAAERTADTFANPAALKIISPDVTHKSDIGGVELNVTDDVRSSYERIVTNVERYHPDATIVGVYVQEMIDLNDRTETIIGAVRDPQFGPVVLFGLGGIFVETLGDTSLRVAPISPREAREMIEDIRGVPMLRGARGRPPADIEAIADTIQRISQLMIDQPDILELDVNPLVVGEEGVSALDFRATLNTEAS